jgi:hypothetical protein
MSTTESKPWFALAVKPNEKAAARSLAVEFEREILSANNGVKYRILPDLHALAS